MQEMCERTLGKQANQNGDEVRKLRVAATFPVAALAVAFAMLRLGLPVATLLGPVPRLGLTASVFGFGLLGGSLQPEAGRRPAAARKSQPARSHHARHPRQRS